jgi:hypothetical protein
MTSMSNASPNQGQLPTYQPEWPETAPQAWKPRLRRWEAAQYLAMVHGLQVAPATLAKYASVGGGPQFQRAGRIPLYTIAALDGWAIDRLGPLVSSTSDCRRMTGRT